MLFFLGMYVSLVRPILWFLNYGPAACSCDLFLPFRPEMQTMVRSDGLLRERERDDLIYSCGGITPEIARLFGVWTGHWYNDEHAKLRKKER